MELARGGQLTPTQRAYEPLVCSRERDGGCHDACALRSFVASACHARRARSAPGRGSRTRPCTHNPRGQSPLHPPSSRLERGEGHGRLLPAWARIPLPPCTAPRAPSELRPESPNPTPWPTIEREPPSDKRATASLSKSETSSPAPCSTKESTRCHTWALEALKRTITPRHVHLESRVHELSNAGPVSSSQPSIPVPYATLKDAHRGRRGARVFLGQLSAALRLGMHPRSRRRRAHE